MHVVFLILENLSSKLIVSKVNKVVKAEVVETSKRSETIYTAYFANDTIPIWVCAPITHSDFVFKKTKC